MTKLSDKDQPILVTGAHRSGTTWVGKMLSTSDQVAYISEPLNVYHRPGIFRAPVTHWYTYICERNEEQYLPALGETTRFKYHTWREIKSLRSAKDVARMGRDWSSFALARLRHQRPLLKDPFAVFSIPWFSQRLGCQVIVLVRHPAAFASSLIRLDWSFDFQDLLAQRLLMRDWLEPFRGEMEAILKTPDDVIDQSNLLWRMIYHVVAAYREMDPDLQWVRHEDLSRDPLGGYGCIYTNLGLEFTPQAQQVVLESSSAANPGELPIQTVHATRVDSRANIDNWRHRLSAGEIDRIRQQTSDVAALYYSEGDWE